MLQFPVTPRALEVASLAFCGGCDLSLTTLRNVLVCLAFSLTQTFLLRGIARNIDPAVHAVTPMSARRTSDGDPVLTVIMLPYLPPPIFDIRRSTPPS